MATFELHFSGTINGWESFRNWSAELPSIEAAKKEVESYLAWLDFEPLLGRVGFGSVECGEEEWHISADTWEWVKVK